MNHRESPEVKLFKLGNSLFSLEVCKNHSEGMMGRNHIPERGGMVFFFDEPGSRSFHMKNCLKSLDIVFCIDGKIDKIYHDCPPCDEEECDKYSHDSSDCVIELPGGSCKKHGINEGLIYRLF